MQPEIQQLLNSFSEIFRSLHQKSYHKMEDKCLYPGQAKLLSLIKAHEGIPQKDLSEKTFVKPATITGALNKLEANHYVYRKPDEADKRIMRVYLTEEGRGLAEQGEAFMMKMTEQIFDGLTPEELRLLIGLTEKIKINLRENEK